MGWRSSSTCQMPIPALDCPSHQPNYSVTATAPSHRAVSTRHQPPKGFRTTWQHRKTFVFPASCSANQVKPPGADHGLLHHFIRWMPPNETRGDPLSWDRHPFVHVVHAAGTATSRATSDQAQSWHLLLKNTCTKEKQSQKTK